MSLLATTPFRAHWHPNWRNLPPPPAPLPVPFQPRRPRDRREGDGNGAMFAAWGLYCHTHGFRASGKEADERMRRGIAKILPEFTGKRSEMSSAQCFQIARFIDGMTQARDGGLHARLFDHCPEFRADRRLLPAAYGLLTGFGEPLLMFGAEPEHWRAVRDALLEHTQTCAGGEACSLLAPAKELTAAGLRKVVA